MNITDLQRILTNSYESLGRLLPDQKPFRVLTVLELCRERAATKQELIERSGFSQSSISILVTKLCAAGAVEIDDPLKRFEQQFKITEKGRSQLLELEDALNKAILAVQPKESLPDSVAQPPGPKESGTQDPPSKHELEPGATEIWKAMCRLYPAVIDVYEERRLKVSSRR